MEAVKYDYDIDEQVNKLGMITGISEEIYYCSISKVSQVYFECQNGVWTAWRETFALNSNKSTGHRTIAKGEFEFVLSELKQYLKYIENNMKKNK